MKPFLASYIIISCIFLGFLFLFACNNRGGSNTPIYTYKPAGSDTGATHNELANTQQGEQLFQQRCSACHGVNGNARNNNAIDLSMTMLDSEGIVTTIKNGRNTMPAFKDAIPDSDIAQIEIYVRSLRQNQKR